jgi:hypothetical protein
MAEPGFKSLLDDPRNFAPDDFNPSPTFLDLYGMYDDSDDDFSDDETIGPYGSKFKY